MEGPSGHSSPFAVFFFLFNTCHSFTTHRNLLILTGLRRFGKLIHQMSRMEGPSGHSSPFAVFFFLFNTCHSFTTHRNLLILTGLRRFGVATAVLLLFSSSCLILAIASQPIEIC